MKTITITDDEATVEAVDKRHLMPAFMEGWVAAGGSWNDPRLKEIYEASETATVRARATLEADRARAVDEGVLVERMGKAMFEAIMRDAVPSWMPDGEGHASWHELSEGRKSYILKIAYAALAAMKGEG